MGAAVLGPGSYGCSFVGVHGTRDIDVGAFEWDELTLFFAKQVPKTGVLINDDGTTGHS